jgi:hypothetical protein
MAHPDEIQAVLKRIFEDPGGDVTNAHEIYHDDAVLEFPQSGERFEGVDAFTAWRSQYPAEVTFRIRRTVIFEDFSVVELSGSYDGGPEMLGVQMLDFRGDKVIRERIYVTESWEAPQWRAPWRSETPAEFG